MIIIPASELDENFERDLKNDIEILKKIQHNWLETNKSQQDPKFDLFYKKRCGLNKSIFNFARLEF